MSYTILPPNMPLVDQSGRISREWFIFFTNIFQTTGGGTTVIPQNDIEAYLLAAYKQPIEVAIENGLRDLANLLNTQSNNKAYVDSLNRRITILEEYIQGLHAPVKDQSLEDLKTVSLGSRTWL